MANTRLLKAVCTVAMLAATPVLAQSQTQPADTGPGNSVNNPVADTGTTATGNRANGTSMSNHSAHRSTMTHSPRTMHGRSDSAENDAVDRLNEQSLRAAHSGRDFQSGATDTPAMMGGGSTSDTGRAAGDGKM
jgi:hypothetical protein